MIAIVAFATIATAGSAVAAPTSPTTVAGPAVATPGLSAGMANDFGLSGPLAVASVFGDPGVSSAVVSHGSAAPTASVASLPNLKGEILRTAVAAPADPPIPTVSCAPASAGCDSVASAPAGVTTNPVAMNATLNDALYPVIGDVEPPDQMMCAGSGYVVEGINIGEVQVFNAKTLMPVSAAVPLDSLMGLTGLGWSSGGDVSCVYDASHGGHWIIIEFVSTSSDASGGPFSGCFAGVLDSCREGIAVSATRNPMGTYNVYFLDPNMVNSDPGSGYLLNDFAKLATTGSALMLFYDEFNLNGATVPACPAFGCGGFNGAQELVFDKAALEAGAPAGEVTAAYENLGLFPTPDGNCGLEANPYTCWYEVIPAASPNPGQFDNAHHGTGFMVASLDFYGVGDTRMAVFYWTGLAALDSTNCAKCGGIGFGGTVFTGLEAYRGEGNLAAQKAGTVPLGTNCNTLPWAPTAPCAENGIASNGDSATQASYAGGQIWTAVTTSVKQTFGSTYEYHLGAAYWSFGTSAFDHGGALTVDSQGYVSAAHEDIVFPTMAATPRGTALMSFTLTGDISVSGHPGGFYPSTAYGLLATGATGLVGGTIFVTANGQAPQDGFTEYGSSVGIGARWGDYGAAVYVAGLGYVFAAEYIQSPACSPAEFLIDPTCGGTRDPLANFGTSISVVPT